MQEKEIVNQYYLERVDRVEVEVLHEDEFSRTLRWLCPLEKRVVTVKAIKGEGGTKITRLD